MRHHEVPEQRAARTIAERDSGFTLIELLVVVVLMGVAATLAVSGFQGYARSAEHAGTRDGVVSALRAAHQRAQAEATAYCVAFAADGKTWSTYRGDCATGTLVKGPEDVGGAQVQLSNVSFLRPDGTNGGREVTFTARGTASKGSLQVARTGSTKAYTVTVEGLTARVSSS